MIYKLGPNARLFSIDSLVSFDKFKSFPFESFSTLHRMTNVAWLKDLVEGQTMKMFDELLETRKEDVQYEIFYGTSGKISQSTHKCPNEIHKEEINIPKYIWTYLKSQDDQREEDFVVVGVNTPFADHSRWNETVFCKDMCDTIKWLKPMEKTRQMPYMGYMFCCNATDEVISFLDGFPKIIN